MTAAGLATGWHVKQDAHGPLLAGPRGAARIDATVVRALEDSDGGDNPIFLRTLELVLARVGALGPHALEETEPPRPTARDRGPSVSVVIPNVDAADLLAACLASLASQQYSPLEVVVVDGGSTDDAVARARSAGARVLSVPRGTNFSEACNSGFAAATGEYVLLLNNDTRLAPDAVAQLMRVVRDDVAAVCAMTRRADLPGIIESLGNVYGHGGFGAGRFAGFADLGQLAEEPELFSAAFTAVLITRRAWDHVGPLDPTYGFYYEDVDWSMRARSAGWKILPAPHALVWHEGSASTSRAPSRVKLTFVTRNRLVMTQKVLPWRTSASFLRAFVKEDVKSVLRSLRHGDGEQVGVVAKAWLGAGVRVPHVLSERRRLAPFQRLDALGLFTYQNGPALMSDEYPVIDAAAIRGFYQETALDAGLISDEA